MSQKHKNHFSLREVFESLDSETEREQLVQILYFQPVYTILFGHALAVLITVVFLWHSVPLHWLLPWAVIIAGQTLIWVCIVGNFRRARGRPHDIGKALRIFPIAGAVTGLLWGTSIYWPNIMSDTTAIVFLSIMVLGVTAAGLAVFAPYLRSFVIFASLTLVPFSIRFFVEGGRLDVTLGTMFLLYFCVLLVSGVNMRRAVAQAISLRLENTGLIEDLKTQFSQAEQSRIEAEQANLSKSKFLAAASHDLRQPLHALGLFVDALESRVRHDEVGSIVANIRVSTEALTDLLNALLDISRLDACVLEPQATEFMLQPLLHRIKTDYTEPAEERALRLKIVDCGLAVKTDPAMLERILRNLVSNAVRYTRDGRVLVGCRRRGAYIDIEVHDTGIGIEPEILDDIFEEFFQAENPERDRRKGLGLGLAIVKRLSELIECPVSVESAPGVGTVFRVRVPVVANARPVREIKVTTAYVDDLKGTRVMIIDDEELIREGLCQLLEQWECSVIQAESIAQALESIAAADGVDIILSDYRLRDNQTGIDAIRRIHEACNETIPAIIMTGDTAPERLRDARDSGYQLLHKPVSSAKLRSLMSYVLDSGKRRAAASGHRSTGPV